MKEIRVEIVTDDEAFHPIDCRIGDMTAQMSIEELIELNRQLSEVIEEYQHRVADALLERGREAMLTVAEIEVGLIAGVTY